MRTERRHFLRSATVACACAAAVPAWLVGACSRADDAPVPIRWDRDTCAMCGMVISDRRCATTVRGGADAAASRFDDLGCAITWLAGVPWGGAEATRIWVTRVAADGSVAWRDARAARYRRARATPMGYGYVPADAGDTATLAFAEVRAALLAAGRHGEARP